jgi:hypothetical protein
MFSVHVNGNADPIPTQGKQKHDNNTIHVIGNKNYTAIYIL